MQLKATRSFQLTVLSGYIPLHVSNIEAAMPINILAGEELRNKQAVSLVDSLSKRIIEHR